MLPYDMLCYALLMYISYCTENGYISSRVDVFSQGSPCKKKREIVEKKVTKYLDNKLIISIFIGLTRLYKEYDKQQLSKH